MTISKRVLIKWRKEALKELQEASMLDKNEFDSIALKVINSSIRLYHQILTLTQELIDQELIKEK